jgi:hypothetical protein
VRSHGQVVTIAATRYRCIYDLRARAGERKSRLLCLLPFCAVGGGGWWRALPVCGSLSSSLLFLLSLSCGRESVWLD